MSRSEFWSDYQPGLRGSPYEPGTREFFDDVTARRYSLEPHVPEVVCFDRWSGRAVLEAGCGIGTDGVQFARAGAQYAGLDFSPTAVRLARRRFQLEQLRGCFVRGSITSIPTKDASFDLVFSHGVIHHIPDTEGAIREYHRVLRPGGTVLVMVYNRRSLNYYLTILLLRRLLVGALLIPGATRSVARLTGEPESTLVAHRELLRTHGLRYVRDEQLFLSHNTDGPGNPLSKVFSRQELQALFGRWFTIIDTEVRYLNVRLYPGGNRLAKSVLGRRLERRWGWHLYLEGRKEDR